MSTPKPIRGKELAWAWVVLMSIVGWPLGLVGVVVALWQLPFHVTLLVVSGLFMRYCMWALRLGAKGLRDWAGRSPNPDLH